MRTPQKAFSLVEVVLAIGIVSFAVLATFGLLSVASNTSKNARDEQAAAQIAGNEFQRIRSLSVANFPHFYNTRYFDANLNDVGTNKTTAIQNGAMYEFSIPNDPNTPGSTQFAVAPSGTGDWLLNAEVHFPVTAPSPNQIVYRFTTVMDQPVATPSPTATP